MQSDTVWNTARLGDYFALLRRRWLIIVTGLVLGVALALAYLSWAPREYTAKTAVLVSDTITGTQSAPSRQSSINLDTEAQLVTATETVAVAADKLHVSGDEAKGLGDRVSVSVPPNTEILDISFVAPTAAEAQNGSLAFAEAYLAQRGDSAQAELNAEAKGLQDRIDAVNTQLTKVLAGQAGFPAGSPQANDQAAALNNQLASLTSQLSLIQTTPLTPGRVVTEPGLPSSPSSPNTLITIAAGVLLGLLAGLGVALLRHRADDLIRTPEDLYRRTRVPVATVLSARLHGGEVSLLPPLSADGRGYARLRNLVTNSLEQSSRRVVLVAGVRRGGGPVAANLAASLARAGEEVFLVCADVFGNTASSLLPDVSGPGLAEVLAGEVDVEKAVHRLPGLPSLRVLGAGSDPDRADALLQTRSPRRLVDELLQTATYVVIEAPATVDSPDAQTLANVAEMAVVVVEAGHSTAREVLDACGQLESMNTPVLGAVIGRYGRDADGDRRRPRTAPAEDEEDHRAVRVPAPVDTVDRPVIRTEHRTTSDQDLSGASDHSPQTVPPDSRDHAPR